MPASDITIIAIIIAARFLMPLLIPIIPLPAVIVCLVVDGIDQTVFQTQLTPSSWTQIEDFYQGYDKAMDIFYLAMAWISTLRNWTNHTAFMISTFLWFYRLVGITIFETLHTVEDPGGFRWLLLFFPNTFEYFFIFIEAVRLRWDPRRLSPAMVILAAWFIWVFIKIPQEFWIHIAKLDFTDFAAANPWVKPTMTVAILALIGFLFWAVKFKLPGGDWRFKVVADPIPTTIDEASERASWVAERKLFTIQLLEKVMLVGLILAIFAQIIPGMKSGPIQMLVSVALLLIPSTLVGLLLARRGFSVSSTLLNFALFFVLNFGIAWAVLTLEGRSFHLGHLVFFLILLTLISGLYDRYRPVHDVRFGENGAPAPAEVPLGQAA